MNQQRFGEPRLRFQLSEQPIHVVDVLGALDLRDHDHVERLAGFEHGGGEVVEPPWRVEAVHPGPELGLAEVDGVRHLDEAGTGGFLLVGRDTIFEVGEQDVDRRCDVGNLRPHLLVGGREEVDHPARRERDLANGLGSTDGERAEEVFGWTHSSTVDLQSRRHQSPRRSEAQT